jgi:serine/threonine protein kinase
MEKIGADSVIADKYIVKRKLGEGATGEVFLVEHRDLSIRLALKILHQTSGNDSKLTLAFKREAELLFRFSHDGCVQLRDFGCLKDGSYFMATDFCEGGTLRDLLLRTGRLSVNFALKILIQVLEVLAAAHRRGIIHRDIKPENIMIERSFEGHDTIKVLDFGLAQLLERQFETLHNDKSPTDRCPRSSGAAGTPEYMSPEQILGGELDGRVDIYSTGIMGYEMIVGHAPFEHEDILQLLILQATKVPNPFPKSLNIPKGIENLIFKALEKEPNNRYGTADDFLKSCNDFISNNKVDLVTFKIPEVESTALVMKTIPGDQVNDQEGEQAKLPNRGVLILDDDPHFVEIIKYVLEHEGYAVYTASNPDSLHSYLFTYRVDLVLLDVHIPYICGAELCRLIKDTVPDVKIVLISNLSDRELASLAEKSLSDGFISKNNTPNQWVEEIEQIIFDLKS